MRMFQTALVDEDVQDGFSTVVYMPGHETEERRVLISIWVSLRSRFSILTSGASRPTEAHCPLRLASELLREVQCYLDEEERSWRNPNLKNRR